MYIIAAGICSMKTEDCTELRKYMLPSGVYTIYPDKYEIKAYCDMKTDGGGWTVSFEIMILKRPCFDIQTFYSIFIKRITNKPNDKFELQFIDDSN